MLKRVFPLLCFLLLAITSCSRREPVTEIAMQELMPTIVIDAGHGGYDPGAVSQNLKEKTLTLETAYLVKEMLIEKGYPVILTRHDDHYMPLAQRVSIANRLEGAVFVSIHYNSSLKKEAKGIEIYYCPSNKPWRIRASKRLAEIMLTSLLKETKAVSRGVKEGRFHVIRETVWPSILVEGGFMSNKEEKKLLMDKEYIRRVSRGIVQGIDTYLTK